MDKEIVAILEQIAKQSQSELINFFIIVLIGLAIIMIPLYTMIIKNNRAKESSEKERLDMYIKREQQLIQVVTTNTEALVSLKVSQEVTLNNLKTAVESGNKNVDKSLDRVHTRLDEVLRQGTLIINNADHLTVLIERSLLNEQTLKDTVGTILLNVEPNKGAI